MKNYVGQKIKGFKFEDGTNCIAWLSYKKDFIGIIGEIIKQGENHVVVDFKDNRFQEGVVYPITMIEAHLLPTEFKLPNKGDLILVSDDDKKWVETIFLAYIEGVENPVISVYVGQEEDFKNGEKVFINTWNFWKPISTKKIKLTKQEIAYKFGINVEQLEITE